MTYEESCQRVRLLKLLQAWREFLEELQDPLPVTAYLVEDIQTNIERLVQLDEPWACGKSADGR